LDGLASVARDGGYRIRSVVNSFATKVQTQLGLLALFGEQCALDYLGLPRWGICANSFAVLPRDPKHQRSNQESKQAMIGGPK
jgi:hypothetical protein